MTPDLRQLFGAPEGRGVLVAHEEPDSLAARAGLQVGDVLTSIGGQKIQSADDVVSALARRRPTDNFSSS